MGLACDLLPAADRSPLRCVELEGTVLAGRDQTERTAWHVGVSAGTLSVRRERMARTERRHEVEVAASRTRADLAASDLTAGRDPGRHDGKTAARISQWSAKSRARMVRVLQQADWTPLLDQGVPAMVTLTYPGDWLAVAPNAAASRRHLVLLRKRYEREFGVRLLGAWKREFQARGAPHFHLLMVPPPSAVAGSFFRWLALTWAELVGAESCGRGRHECQADCERHRHEVAGVAVDYAEGAKCRDPRRIGVYFAKHGSYAAKEYQNHAPREWVDAGSVGRFWGVWGLPSTLREVEVSPDAGIAAARTLRRLSRANAYVTRVPVWRYRTVTAEDGTVTAKWRRASTPRRVYQLRYGAGFVALNDGALVGSQLARWLSELEGPQWADLPAHGIGPRGPLP